MLRSGIQIVEISFLKQLKTSLNHFLKITEITFDEIPKGIEMLEQHKVAGRLVANMEA